MIKEEGGESSSCCTVHTFVVADEDNGANAPILAAECIRFVDQLAVSWVVEDMHALFGN